MRHRLKTIKLGRTSSQREALLSGQVCSLIQEKRITTTLAKAKATRSLAEKMVTLGKKGTLAARRQAVSKLHNKEAVKELFSNVAPVFAERQGGYTRIMKLGRRSSDSSEMAILEWVETAVKAVEAAPVVEEAPKKAPKKTAKKKAAKKKAAKKKAAKKTEAKDTTDS